MCFPSIYVTCFNLSCRCGRAWICYSADVDESKAARLECETTAASTCRLSKAQEMLLTPLIITDGVCFCNCRHLRRWNGEALRITTLLPYLRSSKVAVFPHVLDCYYHCLDYYFCPRGDTRMRHAPAHDLWLRSGCGEILPPHPFDWLCTSRK
jgi:hypothetical protein